MTSMCRLSAAMVTNSAIAYRKLLYTSVYKMEGWQRGGGLLLVWRRWVGGGGRDRGNAPSVYFSHLGDELIADLCEFLNLLIL